MVKKSILSVLFLLIFILSTFPAPFQNADSAKEPKEVKILFPKGYLRCDPSQGTVVICGTSAQPEIFALSGSNEWSIKFFSAGVYLLQQTSWGNNFWQVDIGKRQVIKISEGAGITRKPDQPLGFEVGLVNPGEAAFIINFRKMELKFQPSKGQFKFSGDGFLLSNCGDLNPCKINPQLYHLKNKMLTGDSFWKLDLGAKQWIYTSEGTLCEVSDKDKDSIWPDVRVDVKY
jgi:hypothetical protein